MITLQRTFVYRLLLNIKSKYICMCICACVLRRAFYINLIFLQKFHIFYKNIKPVCVKADFTNSLAIHIYRNKCQCVCVILISVFAFSQIDSHESRNEFLLLFVIITDYKYSELRQDIRAVCSLMMDEGSSMLQSFSLLAREALLAKGEGGPRNAISGRSQYRRK